jgi:hypothetical protein
LTGELCFDEPDTRSRAPATAAGRETASQVSSLLDACLALAVALSGVGYAATAIPRNSVGAPQLKANAVTSGKVKNGNLKAADLAPGVIPPSGAIVRTRTAGVNFGAATTIITASGIPAGNYIAVYRGDVVNFGVTSTDQAYMRCWIESPPGTTIAGGTTFAHDDDTAGGKGEVIVNQMTVVDVITLTTPDTVQVRCSADSGAGPYIENNRLFLIPVKSIDKAAVTS